MSNFLAIGGVSNTLKNLLNDRMEIPTGATSVSITIGTPSINNNLSESSRINLFLYKVEENPNLKNQEIPGMGHPCAYCHPPLSLNLYYLITAYGSTLEGDSSIDETLSQQVLGSCMRVFHDCSFITDNIEIIGTSVANILDPSLQNEFEKIKITLEPISLDEISKIWSSFSTPLRVSVAYRVSVIQIENRQVRRITRPVLTRRIHVSTLKRPEITDIYRTPSGSESVGDGRATVGNDLTIEGNNFIAPKTWVKIGSLERIGVSSLSDKNISIKIPGDQYPEDPDHPTVRIIPVEDRLQLGPQLVKVLIQKDTEVVEGGLDHGRVVEDQRIQESNSFVFMLVPEINNINPNDGTSATTSFTLNGKRLFHKNGKTLVLIYGKTFTLKDDIVIEIAKPNIPVVQLIEINNLVVPLETLVTSIESLKSGKYEFIVRVIVNGIQSITEAIYTYTKS